jgi:plasmid stability protein
MTNILIRDLDDEVVARLKLRAKNHHRSLQAELKSLVESAVQFSIAETKQVSRVWHKNLSTKKHTDSADLLHEDRKR